MKIAIIGATGHAGQAAAKAAQAHKMDVTAIVRHADKARKLFGAGLPILEKDLMALTQADLSGFDAIIDFSAPHPAYLHLDGAAKLIAMFREQQDTRLFFIVGSSSLVDAEGQMQLTKTLEKYADQPWVGDLTESVHKLEFLKMVDNVAWTVMTPQDNFTDGPQTQYRLGSNEVLHDKNGQPEVSTGNFAAALVDELLSPKHIRQQFTVVND
ncbi:NAD(P)-dependent oxidoreductase [Lacticaseibacillus brantae]|uniref:NAD-dependent epimerase dehydratase n=1 Tax=Lacticaseibacillus brantae DSM 23927 TaxID=1423727 RepID=A0A0R2AWZ9_9LACO|nr:NAD(P)H-binding protein [Lacticaseibacillus brantae]KRM71821.1 NAD-dependent epimerase dehydratase [Lacticaseibacillus brantae DSM 23927]